MSRNSSRYTLKARGERGFGAYHWLPPEEPCFVYATRPCADRWQCDKPIDNAHECDRRVKDEMEFFVFCCLYDAAWFDESHPERVQRLEFHWNAISWGVMDRKIGEYAMMGNVLQQFWNTMTLKRDRMVARVRHALKRMIEKGWITRTAVSTPKFGNIALYAPTQALVELLHNKESVT